MSRLNKAEQIIELAMMLQNSYCGLTIDDIAELLARESWWKETHGSRQFGYNKN